MNKAIAAWGLAAAIGCGPALARGDDKENPKPVETPYLKGSLGIQLRFDGTFAGDDDPGRRALLYLDEGDAEFSLHPTDWLALKAHVKGSTVRGPAPRTSEAFRGFGVFMEELYVDLDFKHVAFFAGKFNPAFGLMHKADMVRGIFSRDFALDYELTEKVGFGASLRGDAVEHGLGRHELTAALFFEDTTILRCSLVTSPAFSEPLTTRASTLSLGDGGVANTETPNNAAIALTGGGFGFAPDLEYHLGYRLQRASPAGLAAGTETADEHGVSVGFRHEFKIARLPGGTTVTPMVEWARLWNAGGNEGQLEYFSAAVAVATGPWELWLSGSLRSAFASPAAADIHDKVFSVSLDHQVTDWMKAGAGYRFRQVADIGDHTIGIRLWFTHDFTLPLRR